VIDSALRIVASELQAALQPRGAGSDKLVVVSNLAEAGGGTNEETNERVAIFLVNIQREDVPMRAPRTVDFGEDRLAVRMAPVHLSLLVMVAANFGGSKYNEALKLIAGTIAFFQGKPLFTPANVPDLDSGIEQLSIEMENLSTTDLSNLWGVFGGRYVPSVLYRLRLLSIDAGLLAAQQRRIEQTEVNTAAGAVA
jgi:Pvc16 N-terminal domain